MKTILLLLLLSATGTMFGCSNLVKHDPVSENNNTSTNNIASVKNDSVPENENITNSSQPAGKLIYCSYASVGHAALGTDYCELIADSGVKPKIVVVLNENCHFADKETHEYEVDSTVVAEVQQGLAELEAWKTNGYSKSELMDGGRSHRYHIEYDTNEKIHASWFTSSVDPNVLAVYNYLESFFRPWYEKAQKEGDEGNDVVEEE